MSDASVPGECFSSSPDRLRRHFHAEDAYQIWAELERHTRDGASVLLH